MKHLKRTNLAIASSVAGGLALALALAAWSPVQAQSVTPEESRTMIGARMMGIDAGMMDAGAVNGCREMMEQKEKIAAEMKTQDAAMTARLARMNGAPADSKVDEIAAVVNLMAEHRIALDARMGKLHEEMMPHMMKHVQVGHDSMMQCPMMMGTKGMRGMGGKTLEAPNELK